MTERDLRQAFGWPEIAGKPCEAALFELKLRGELQLYNNRNTWDSAGRDRNPSFTHAYRIKPGACFGDCLVEVDGTWTPKYVPPGWPDARTAKPKRFAFDAFVKQDLNDALRIAARKARRANALEFFSYDGTWKRPKTDADDLTNDFYRFAPGEAPDAFGFPLEFESVDPEPKTYDRWPEGTVPRTRAKYMDEFTSASFAAQMLAPAELPEKAFGPIETATKPKENMKTSPIEIKTRKSVNGADIANLSNSEIANIVKAQKEDIAELKELNAEPIARITAEIEKREAGLKAFIAAANELPAEK